MVFGHHIWYHTNVFYLSWQLWNPMIQTKTKNKKSQLPSFPSPFIESGQTHILFSETSPLLLKKPSLNSIKPVRDKPSKLSAEALDNVCKCNISSRQRHIPCVKGDKLSITISEDKYLIGLESYKHNLHGRIYGQKDPLLSDNTSNSNKIIHSLELNCKVGYNLPKKGLLRIHFLYFRIC